MNHILLNYIQRYNNITALYPAVITMTQQMNVNTAIVSSHSSDLSHSPCHRFGYIVGRAMKRCDSENDSRGANKNDASRKLRVLAPNVSRHTMELLPKCAFSQYNSLYRLTSVHFITQLWTRTPRYYTTLIIGIIMREFGKWNKKNDFYFPNSQIYYNETSIPINVNLHLLTILTIVRYFQLIPKAYHFPWPFKFE